VPDDSPAERDDRVCLLVDGDRDRTLLRERLRGRYEVVTGGGPDRPVDLCIVDAESYRDQRETLLAERHGSVGYLPVLLLVPDREGAREAAWLAEALDGPVDDVLVVPAPRHEFDARVAALLRMRRQARDLALYRRAMDEATVGITISDPTRPDNPLVYANDAFVAITGYDREETLGRNCRFLQGPGTDEEAVAEVRAAIDDERPVVTELLNYRADGEPFWNRLTVAPVRDRAGEVSHFVGFQQDVTDHVERDRTLEQYEAVVEAATEPICILDPDGNFVRVNDAMVAATGYPREDLLGSHASTVAGEETVDRAEDQIAGVLAGDRDRVRFEASLVAADGTRREYAVSMSVLGDAGAFEGTALVAHEVTDLREHQRRLSVLDRVLRHNLRNKLNVVIARAAQIGDESDDESVREAATAVERAADDLLGHSEAVRRFGGVVDPRTTERRTVDAVETVERALEGLRATYPGTRFELDAPASAPVVGDETLAIAIEELVENAAGSEGEPDATVAGDVSALGTGTRGEERAVAVSVTDDPAAGVVELTVVDVGSSLSDRGRRALERGAETPLEHTTGLGLWLVRWAVENVDGEIHIEENEPSGTVVRVRLPRAVVE
jgi:PAS domain S-box-containing protein